MFFNLQNGAFSNHNSPHIHHKFTIKTPQQNTRFFPTPIKKRQQNLKKQASRALHI
jgi:hypothetical protein